MRYCAKKFTLSICVLLTCLSTYAQQSDKDTDEYEKNLINAYGSVRGVEAFHIICAEYFPELISDNQAAYETWQSKYRNLIQEIQQHVDAHISDKTKGDAVERVLYTSSMERYFALTRAELGKRMIATGASTMEKNCRAFPKFFTTDDADLVLQTADKMAKLRDYKKKRVIP